MSAESNESATGCYVTREYWPKRMWRNLLRAHWKHQDIKSPCEVEMIPALPIESPRHPAVMAKDAIINRIEIHLSFWDLLRCALGCVLQVNTVTYCENLPGAVKTETQVFPTIP